MEVETGLVLSRLGVGVAVAFVEAARVGVRAIDCDFLAFTGGYGMTEFGAVSAMPVGDGGRHLGSVGVPLPGVDVRILGPGGAPLPMGEVGEVAIGGTRPGRSYLDDPEGASA